MLPLLYALTLSRHEFSIKHPCRRSHIKLTLGAPELPQPPQPPGPPSLASLMRTGPCVFDPAASPAAFQPHAYSTLPAASPVTPPSPWVAWRSEAPALPGRCWISKPPWMKLISACAAAREFLLFVPSDDLEMFHPLMVENQECF